MIKTRYLLLGITLLFVTLTFFSFYFYWQENKTLLTESAKQAEQAGLKFAQQNNQQACLDRVIQDSQTCRDSNCSVELKQFFYHCFHNASPSTSICDKVPSMNDYIATISWGTSTCRKAKVKNGSCNNAINELPLWCEHIKQ